MPDPLYRLAVLATRVRVATESLGEVSTALGEMKRLELSTQALDLAIESAKLHYHLTQLLLHPGTSLPCEGRSHPPQEELPF